MELGITRTAILVPVCGILLPVCNGYTVTYPGVCIFWLDTCACNYFFDRRPPVVRPVSSARPPCASALCRPRVRPVVLCLCLRIAFCVLYSCIVICTLCFVFVHCVLCFCLCLCIFNCSLCLCFMYLCSCIVFCACTCVLCIVHYVLSTVLCALLCFAHCTLCIVLCALCFVCVI